MKMSIKPKKSIDKYKAQLINPSKTKQGQYLGRYVEAPKFLQDNQHIIEGYRIGFNSFKKVVGSLFMIHNQTVNIWSHLIGAIIALFLIFQGIAYQMEESHILGKTLIKNTVSYYKLGILRNQKEMDFPAFDNSVPSWPIMFALLGGTICLSCSAVFHWIHPMSEKVYKLSHCLDFAGIGINMAFSPIPGFYYAMYCNKSTGYTYLAIIITAGTASFISNLFDWTHRKENSLLKFSILILSSVACAVGLTHIMINQFVFNNYGDNYTIVPSLYFFIPTLVSYLIGFMFYITRCPQRNQPGSYDICGHSHQIWHIFVFLAIIFTYLGSIASYQIRSHYSYCPVSMQSPYQ